jgi:hypothetical protein
MKKIIFGLILFFATFSFSQESADPLCNLKNMAVVQKKILMTVIHRTIQQMGVSGVDSRNFSITRVKEDDIFADYKITFLTLKKARLQLFSTYKTTTGASLSVPYVRFPKNPYLYYYSDENNTVVRKVCGYNIYESEQEPYRIDIKNLDLNKIYGSMNPEEPSIEFDIPLNN